MKKEEKENLLKVLTREVENFSPKENLKGGKV